MSLLLYPATIWSIVLNLNLTPCCHMSLPYITGCDMKANQQRIQPTLLHSATLSLMKPHEIYQNGGSTPIFHNHHQIYDPKRFENPPPLLPPLFSLAEKLRMLKESLPKNASQPSYLALLGPVYTTVEKSTGHGKKGVSQL